MLWVVISFLEEYYGGERPLHSFSHRGDGPRIDKNAIGQCGVLVHPHVNRAGAIIWVT